MGIGLFLLGVTAVYVGDVYFFFAVLPRYVTWLQILGIGVGTALLGVWSARQQSLYNLKQGMGKLMHGQPPANNVVEALLIVAGGIFLVLPGLLTDVVGVLFLFPKTRVAARNLLALYVRRKMQDGEVQVTVRTQSF